MANQSIVTLVNHDALYISIIMLDKVSNIKMLRNVNRKQMGILIPKSFWDLIMWNSLLIFRVLQWG